jgi:hypothetical protein
MGPGLAKRNKTDWRSFALARQLNTTAHNLLFSHVCSFPPRPAPRRFAAALAASQRYAFGAEQASRLA